MGTLPKFCILWRFVSVALCMVLLVSIADVARAQEGQDDGEGEEPSVARALAILNQMTLDEKVNMLHGELNDFYGFYNRPIERLGIPALTMADGPVGVRIAHPDINDQRATQMPSSLALASTWDPGLAAQYGSLVGEEAHSTGHNVLLAPTVDTVRMVQWGRAFETYGEEPLLNGALAAAYIRGVQSNPGVISTIKHHQAYVQETNRLLGADVVVDERTLMEIYARPAIMAVRGGQPGAAMCGFNKVNGVYSCENNEILNRGLKARLDFQGWVMSDYNAAHSTIPSILAGLDQEMPGNMTPDVGRGDCYFCGPLLDAVRSGQVPESEIDEAVLRILRSMFERGLFDHPPVISPLPEAEHGGEAREIAEQAIVLLKNDDGALPFDDQVNSIAVIGRDANTVVAGGGSALVKPTYTVSPLEGIRSRAGDGVAVRYTPGADPVTSVALLPGPDPVPSDFLTLPSGEGNGLRAEYFLNQDFSGTPELDRVEPYAGINGGFFIVQGLNSASPHFPEQPQSLNTNISVRWTGSLTAPVDGTYELALTSSGTSRLYVDEEMVLSTEPGDVVTRTAMMELEAGSMYPVRIEYVNDAPQAQDTGPQFKFGWTSPEGVVAPLALAAAELAHDADVAVVVVRDYSSEGGDLPSLDLPNGQGELIRQVAAANPRTIVVLTTGTAIRTADWDDDVAAILQAWYGGQEQGSAIASVLFGDVNPSGKLPITMPVDEASAPINGPEFGLVEYFSEGIFIGYRGYEQFDIAPQYAFGHGLSYTTFEYSNLRISETSALSGIDSPFEATVNVRNAGGVTGTETVQVYVGNLPTELESAPKALAGWGKVTLQPGENRDVTVKLNRESLSYWHVDDERWVMTTGEVPIYVGSSSADIRLTGMLNTGDSPEP